MVRDLEVWCSFDGALLDRLYDLLLSHSVSPAEYLDVVRGIANNLDCPDDDEDWPVAAAFELLERMFPRYLDLLAVSLEEYGTEAYSEGLPAVPTLLVGTAEGERQFSFLQQAAIEAGISNPPVRSWYALLHGMMAEYCAQIRQATLH